MAVHQNIRDDDSGIVEYVRNPTDHQPYLIVELRADRYRVYADAGYYSQVSGGVTKKGSVAKDADGKIVAFKNKAAAEAWVEGGMRLYEHGDPIEIPGRV